ncbi:CLUMA_CG000621, isoform A [Clunio marinus]|uniref:CLUMA_CG000621, isoform A n=1 Tax=Clunio marinus TaxID=568069 RepID=A0A1J1HJZ3_9DIPT|nr:CLUMA_CG000621, isoform A [Clunio marinus]
MKYLLVDDGGKKGLEGRHRNEIRDEILQGFGTVNEKKLQSIVIVHLAVQILNEVEKKTPYILLCQSVNAMLLRILPICVI